MSVPLVSAEQLAAELGEPGLVVVHATVELPGPRVDGESPVRPGHARFEQEHIPGAVHGDLLGDLARVDAPFRFAQPAAADLAGRLRGLGIGAGTRVVAYDDDGMIWAARLWWALEAIGFDDVAVLDGGLGAWRSAGGALEAGGGGAPPPPPRFAARERPGRFADRRVVEEVLAGERDAQLLCTLSEAAFHGRVPTRYARRGHIPGSRNVPARGLVDPGGRLLEPGLLRERLAPVLGDPRPILAYCGGAISATLGALALRVAGREDVAVYDGSLEEWSADPALPLETVA